jgi:hypothetical protein
MAKNSLPMMRAGGGVVSKAVSVFVLIGVLVFVVKQPVAAAHLLNGLMTLFTNLVAGLANFVQHVSA